MRNLPSGRRCGHVERISIAWGCLLIGAIELTAPGGALAQAARTALPHGAAASAYVVDGLALNARVDFDSAAYRGYQCSQSELFPDLTRCQRSQRQQDWSGRRVFDMTNSILRDRDGKAVYINHHIAPWIFDRNEIQAELKAVSSRLGERAREMRLPPREGVQTAVIAVWGKVELTPLDADATAVLAAGESPRKGLLVDYLGNLRRSAQLGLPVFSIGGGAGYLWSASLDRNNRGHVRVLTVDPAALGIATTVVASAAPDAPPPVAEAPAENETTAGEKANLETAPALAEAEKTSTETELTKSESAEPAAPEPVNIAASLPRPKSAQSDSGQLKTLSYWAFGTLAAVLMIAVPMQLRTRKKLRALKAQVSTSEARAPVQKPEGQSSPAQAQLPAEQAAAAPASISQPAAATDGISSQAGKAQKHETANGSGEKTAEPAAVHQTAAKPAQSPPADVIVCTQCTGEISTDDKFCMHCGTAAAREKRDPTTRLCSCCREEIGAADKFCRHCGASSLQITAPSVSMNGSSASAECVRGADV